MSSKNEGGSQASGETIGPGALVLIVGPSGSGKDTVLAGVKEQFRNTIDYVFPARIVTRKSHVAEDHRTMSESEFLTSLRDNAFALMWEAHGLRYGIPRSVDDAVRDGKSAIINASRGIINLARNRYTRVPVILIECPIEIRARRLASRGREDEREVRSRLDRKVDAFGPTDADLVIDNSGSATASVRILSEYLLAACKPVR